MKRSVTVARRDGVSSCHSILATVLCLCALLSGGVQAYTVEVTTNTVLEQTWLKSTQDQFLSVLTPNPFVPNTYRLQLLAPNPNYVAPGQLVPSAPCELDQDIRKMVESSTWSYVYGFRDGMTYQQQAEIGVAGFYANLCSGATNFQLSSASTTTWNKATCIDTVGTLIQQIYGLSTDTPTVIPGMP